MARIFVSHSSRDNAEAAALAGWLRSEGFDDFFLDFEPERGIAAGERWERALYEAANRCEAVIFLVSRDWLASEWCAREFDLAAKLSKRIFGVLIGDLAPDAIPLRYRRSWQLTSLGAGEDHRMFHVRVPPDDREAHVTFSENGLKRLRTGLFNAGLNPSYFAWPPADDPERAPYRGLAALEAEDAGIFFGREAPLVAAMDRLRALSERAPPRLFVVLGASGAGKSSFLRAGLWPRLRRDDRHFLPLPVVRPGKAPISGPQGLVASLAKAASELRLGKSRADVATALAEPRSTLDLMAALATAATPAALSPDDIARPVALVLAIDQADELFPLEGRAEAEALLAFAATVTRSDDVRLIVVFTIRSEFYERLQSATILEGMQQETFSLEPMPRGAFEGVIEGPARRLKDTRREFAVDPALTDALLRDMERAGGRDALPLLAFTLERLYREHGGKGAITRADYEASGGVVGSIEAAVDEALATATGEAGEQERAGQLVLLRRGLIPWLAGIDPATGEPRRNIARRASLPAESLPLIDRLIEVRLLLSYNAADAGAALVEPAHEALLRQWPVMVDWLKQDQARLAALSGVRQATRDWVAHGRNPRWLAHGAGRLEDAEALRTRPDLMAYLEDDEEDYLLECRRKEDADRNRELEQARRIAEEAQNTAAADRRGRRRALIGAAMAALFAVAAIGAAGYAAVQARRAETARAEAVNEKIRADTALQAGITTANGLVFDLARRFRDRTGVPLALVRGMLDFAIKLQDVLRTGQATRMPALERSTAAALTEMGSILLTAGDSNGAQEAFGKAYAIAESLAAADPDNVDAQLDLAISTEKKGNLAFFAGDAATALSWYRKELAIFEALPTTDLADVRIQNGLAIVNEKLGNVALGAGDTDEARNRYEKELAIYEKLAKADPGNAAVQRSLAITYEKFGDLTMQSGDSAAAREWYEKELAIFARLAADDRGNAEAQRSLAIVYEKLGDLERQSGARVAARGWYEKERLIFEMLAADRDNIDNQRSLAIVYEKLGDLAVQTGDTASARGLFEKAVAVDQTLLVADPGNADDQRGLAIDYGRLGDLAVQTDSVAALGWYEKERAIFEDQAIDRSNLQAQRSLSMVYEKLGDLTAQTGDTAAARGWYQRELSILTALPAPGSVDAGAQIDLSNVYGKLGDLARQAGDGVAARDWFERGLAIAEALATSAPGNAGARRARAVFYNKLGDVALDAGDAAAARAWFEKALAIAEALATGEPADPGAQRDLMVSYNKLGYAAMSAHDTGMAQDWFEKGLAIAGTLARTRPLDADAQRDLSVSYYRLGSAAADAGDTAMARNWLEKNLAIAKMLSIARPADVGAQRDLSDTYDNLGQVAVQAGDITAARDWFGKCLAIVTRLKSEGRLDPGGDAYIADLEETLRKLPSP